jgi:hypothetical protein
MWLYLSLFFLSWNHTTPQALGGQVFGSSFLWGRFFFSTIFLTSSSQEWLTMLVLLFISKLSCCLELSWAVVFYQTSILMTFYIFSKIFNTFVAMGLLIDSQVFVQDEANKTNTSCTLLMPTIFLSCYL